MKLKVGQTLQSAVDATMLVVVRCPDNEVTLTCGGVPMAPKGELGELVAATTADGAGALLGKRYTVEGFELELLCTKGGDNPVAVDGAPVELKSAKPLPASD